MTEIYRFRGMTLIVRATDDRITQFSTVTRLTRTGGERRTAYRPDVVRALGTRIDGTAPPLPPSTARHRSNGELVAR